jgi:hypothetical protein
MVFSTTIGGGAVGTTIWVPNRTTGGATGVATVTTGAFTTTTGAAKQTHVSAIKVNAPIKTPIAKGVRDEILVFMVFIWVISAWFVPAVVMANTPDNLHVFHYRSA